MREGNEHLRDFDPIHFGSKRDGYEFTGRYVEPKTGQTRYGNCPVLIFDSGGECRRILWAYHVGLRAAWNAAGPQPGDVVTVTRSEEATPFGSEGKSSFDYTVTVEQADPAETRGGQTDAIPY
jgi:hypothetical protein